MIQFLNNYKNLKVLVTGSTGFKGSWLALWLHQLGADVTGYGLAPINTPNMFESVRNDQSRVSGTRTFLLVAVCTVSNGSLS